MTEYNVDSLASSTFGIVGMGIGMSVLAHTAKDVSDTMSGRSHRRPTRSHTIRYTNTYKIKPIKIKQTSHKFKW